MSEQAIIKAISPVFKKVFENETLSVHRSLDASQVENWDSLNHITLIVELESKTGIVFTTDELASLSTVGDLIDQLLKRGYQGEKD